MYHLDTGEIKTYDVMPNGTLRVLSTVARTGWLEYTKGDGSKSWEYVSPEVLFDAKHLDSLQGLTLTLDHPFHRLDKSVKPETWHEDAIGMSSTQIIPNYSEGTIDVISLIGAKRGIDAILKDGYRGISEGYHAPLKIRTDSTDINPTFDQTSRVANHYSICKHPRGGDLTKLHLDSNCDVAVLTNWDVKDNKQHFFIQQPKEVVKPKWQLLSVTL